ncbi:alpha/beta fold hydrolase [Kitasatospora sp. CM 4170]|uniref:RBBP9/YdeN family alpha/beta hydrolase n=1 Tax=Kitasatospora aburaviensis TaxID=67265 RepID=A0ABW1EU85_9ACTN|nr:alpha/beta fold hydrolase [Kitasatospora sp. CM 4170]WNM44043.1 alpha/beta fold hydrolase [Kitasatospora sp. CM 4170]
MSDRTTYLVLPGYQSSGPAHWQSRWEAADPVAFRRVEQEDWDHPEPEAWVAALDAAVAGAAADGQVVLVAHSLGCATVARWVATAPAERTAAVRGALLVAPADIDTADVPPLFGFRPVAREPLPFPAIVVNSTDDPWVSPERGRGYAEAWGARYVEVGALGHINSDSALGDWPEGRKLLAEL